MGRTVPHRSLTCCFAGTLQAKLPGPPMGAFSMTAPKRTVAAWLTIAVLSLDLLAEGMRLAVCVATPPGPAAEACYNRIGPVSQAFQKLRLVIAPPPPHVESPREAHPPVVVPKGETKMEQLRKQPSL